MKFFGSNHLHTAAAAPEKIVLRQITCPAVAAPALQAADSRRCSIIVVLFLLLLYLSFLIVAAVFSTRLDQHKGLVETYTAAAVAAPAANARAHIDAASGEEGCLLEGEQFSKENSFEREKVHEPDFSTILTSAFLGVSFSVKITALLVFFLTLWSLVGSFCPVYLLPIQLQPASIRTNVLQQLKGAKAVLSAEKERQKQLQKQQNHQQLQQLLQPQQQRQWPQWHKLKEKHYQQTVEREQYGEQHHKVQPALLKMKGQQQQLQREGAKEEEEYINEKRKKAERLLLDFRNRGIGFVHALVASLLCLWCVVFDKQLHEDKMRNQSFISLLQELIMTSYFMWDMAVILLHWDKDSFQWLVHSSISLLSVSHPLAVAFAADGQPCMAYYAAAIGLFELSTPFIALRYFFLKGAPQRCQKQQPQSKQALLLTEQRQAQTVENVQHEPISRLQLDKHEIQSHERLARQRQEEQEHLHESNSWQQRYRRSRNYRKKASDAVSSIGASSSRNSGTALEEATSTSVSRQCRPDCSGSCSDTESSSAALKSARKHGDVAFVCRNRVISNQPQHPYESGHAATAAEKKGTDDCFSKAASVYGSLLSTGFAASFFFVRIAWGVCFLFPEIYREILGPRGASLHASKKIFFICAMPAFSALNVYWMLRFRRSASTAAL